MVEDDSGEILGIAIIKTNMCCCGSSVIGLLFKAFLSNQPRMLRRRNPRYSEIAPLVSILSGVRLQGGVVHERICAKQSGQPDYAE